MSDFHCNNCPNDLLCGDQGECLNERRRTSRRILDQLSVGERLMLMFGRGVIKHDPLRVEWKEPSPTADNVRTSSTLPPCPKPRNPLE
jgi:hypothetical protein